MELIERLIGAPFDSLSDETRLIAQSADLRYDVIEGADRDAIIRDEVKLECPDRPGINGWDACWLEVRERFESSNDPRDLVPKFLKPDVAAPCRLLGQYVMPSDPGFLHNIQRVILSHLAGKYLTSTRTVIEVGCGSGFNLVELRRLLPRAVLYGADFSPSAVDIVNLMGFGGLTFDIRSPMTLASELATGGAVLTMGALEQVGRDFMPFMQWLMEAKPAVCIHVEPLVELYDKNDLMDVLAWRYHYARGYLQGFLPKLSEARRDGKIDILEFHRTRLGSVHNDGFSWVVWRPR